MDLFLFDERVGGIEPPSSAWKADIITTIRHPLVYLCTSSIIPIIYFLSSIEARRVFRYNTGIRGISSLVECDLPKVEKRVRFSYPAPNI
jgi:hypothetical protein